MANQMTLARVAAQGIAVVKARIKFSDIPTAMFPMMDKVWGLIRRRELNGHGHNVWLYRTTPGDEYDVEIGVQLDALFEPEGDVVASQTPAGVAAHTFHHGEYDALPQVHSALAAWCAEQGHEPAGVNWEVYGDWHEDASKRRTDIYHLCASAELCADAE